MAGLSEIFGENGVGTQLFLWGVVSQVIGALLTPEIEGLTQLSYAIDANTPLDAGDIADMVVRGFMTEDKAAGEAKLTGVDADRLKLLIANAGQSPTPAVIAEGVRRGILSWDTGKSGMPSGNDGIKQGNVKDEWIPLFKQLTTQIPSVAEVMDAWLEGQIEEPEARKRYIEAGGDPTWFQTSFNANGSAPTPTELGVMLNRKIIPSEGTGPKSVSYHQGFLEGPWRNKWETPMRKLAEYLPPPRTVTAMLKNGSLTKQQALDLLIKQGLTTELATAYVNDAEHSQSQAGRDLTLAQIISLYEAQILAASDALTMLESLGYPATNAQYLLSLADLRVVIAQVNAAVSRIRSLYTGHKISKASAVASLNQLQLPADQVTKVVQAWDIEQAANISQLTASQIAQAVKYKVIPDAEALQALESLGYSPRDAWILLSVELHAPQPNEPKAGPGPAPGQPGGPA